MVVTDFASIVIVLRTTRIGVSVIITTHSRRQNCRYTWKWRPSTHSEMLRYLLLWRRTRSEIRYSRGSGFSILGGIVPNEDAWLGRSFWAYLRAMSSTRQRSQHFQKGLIPPVDVWMAVGIYSNIKQTGCAYHMLKTINNPPLKCWLSFLRFYSHFLFE